MTFQRAPTLDEVFTAVLARRESRGLLRQLTTPDKDLVDFSSNDYLSLSKHPKVKQAYISRLQHLGELGTEELALGSGGSRLLDGNTELAESLERSLADFHGAEAGLLFNSGYEANTGLLASAPQAGDVMISDEAIHASVHSGIKLSRAELHIPFKHNCVWETTECDGHEDSHSQLTTSLNAGSLERTLKRLVEGEIGKAILAGQRHVFIAVEALYSMDGDIAPLKDVVECVEKYLPMGNGLIIVDEAHSNGILGDRGRGLVCQLGLESRIWASVLTFGKAMGCSGGKLTRILRSPDFSACADRFKTMEMQLSSSAHRLPVPISSTTREHSSIQQPWDPLGFWEFKWPTTLLPAAKQMCCGASCKV